MHVPIYLKKDMKVVTLKSQQWTQLLKVRMKVKNLNVNGTGSKDTNSPPWTRSQMMSFAGLFTMVPTVDEHPRHHREYMDQSLNMMMRETNDLLRNRIRRLQRDLEAASLVNDQPGMDAIQMQILEAQNLMYAV